MKDFWDKRYSEKNYAYGKEPNMFFRTQILGLSPGRLLLPAEGEGRNAVYAASLGWEVDAFDYSEQGRQKAEQLANEVKIKINYFVADMADFDFAPQSYDMVGLIFVHVPKTSRKRLHSQCIGALKEGGLLLLEAFAKEQLVMNTGGPKDAALLYQLEDLVDDFSGLDIVDAARHRVPVLEGKYHSGDAEIIRIRARKPE